MCVCGLVCTGKCVALCLQRHSERLRRLGRRRRRSRSRSSLLLFSFRSGRNSALSVFCGLRDLQTSAFTKCIVCLLFCIPPFRLRFSPSNQLSRVCFCEQREEEEEEEELEAPCEIRYMVLQTEIVFAYVVKPAPQ